MMSISMSAICRRINIPGFKILRSDRHSSNGDKNKGGGVALYVKQGIKTKVLAKLFDGRNKIEGAEFILFASLFKRGSLLIAVVYRTNSCTSSNTSILFGLLIEQSSKYNDVLIVGDFNINLLDHFKFINLQP